MDALWTLTSNSCKCKSEFLVDDISKRHTRFHQDIHLIYEVGGISKMAYWKNVCSFILSIYWCFRLTLDFQLSFPWIHGAVFIRLLSMRNSLYFCNSSNYRGGGGGSSIWLLFSANFEWEDRPAVICTVPAFFRHCLVHWELAPLVLASPLTQLFVAS